MTQWNIIKQVSLHNGTKHVFDTLQKFVVGLANSSGLPSVGHNAGISS